MACNGDIQPEVKQGSSSYKGLGCNQQTTGRSEAALAWSPQILQISHTNVIPKGILPYFTCHFCLAKSPCAVDKNMSQPRWPHCPKSKHVQHDKTLFTISCIYIYYIMGLSKNGGIPIICSPGKSLVSSGNISSLHFGWYVLNDHGSDWYSLRSRWDPNYLSINLSIHLFIQSNLISSRPVPSRRVSSLSRPVSSLSRLVPSTCLSLCLLVSLAIYPCIIHVLIIHVLSVY